ncbi:hypothetical protein D8B22_02420 [Verminephrobacter aporrectodeae subsp. tuberculatae]|uniref:Ig-like domain-containing protein n=1 Tax=Verminephrobacter aporrectodeae TaxID=1110389 RepID=UPI0022447A16|nr:Ig-like domain-containing protein [Verminephrobacter aporrectodeae]MCW8163774.1 hypothetical protein [Verminephrobacter aporrectodeae subsp. tuberculatae]MCW8168009.1 hypothetical protein [Verminephrobacter aporrectodeae subsp. tuberculatae]
MSTKLDRTSQMPQIDNGDPAPKDGKPTMVYDKAVIGKNFSNLTGANDTAAPKAPMSPRITIDSSKLAAGEPATITFAFDEPVKNLKGFVGDILGGPGDTLSDLSSADGGRTWTGMLTGENDAAPRAPMSPRITIDDSKLAAGGPATVTFAFDEPVKNLAGFPEGLLNGPGDTPSDLSSADGGRTWTGTLTGANNTAASISPVPFRIAIDDSKLAAGGPATVTVTFDKPVESIKGLAKDILSGPDSTLSDLRSADGGRTWTGTLSLVANTSDAGNATADNNDDVNTQSPASSTAKVTLPDTAHKADKEQGDPLVLKGSAEATVAPAAKAEEQVLADDQSSTESKSKVEQDKDYYAKVVDDRDGNCYGDDYSNGDYNWDYNWDGNCDDASGVAADTKLLIVGRASESDAESYWF